MPNTIKVNGRGEACSTHGRETSIWNFNQETWRED